MERPFRPSLTATGSETRGTHNLPAKPQAEVEDPASLERDYLRLVSDAALVDLPSLCILEAFGPDTISFLQGMITNDLAKLLPGEGCLAAVLTPIGKIISDLMALRLDQERCWLIVRRDLSEKVEQSLNRFIVSDEVEIRALPNWSALAMLGPLSRRRLSAIVPRLPDKQLASVEFEIKGDTVRLIRFPRLGLDGYHVWVPSARKRHWMDLIQATCGVDLAPGEVLEVLRIEAGVPECGVDFDESNIPLECNLDELLNFNKGCYTGQEIVARVANLGQISRKLVGLIVRGEKIPRKGEEIRLQGQSIGRITSATRSLALKQPVALGYVQRKHLEYGKEVELSSGSKATIRELPFIVRVDNFHHQGTKGLAS